MTTNICKSLQERRPAIERALDAFKAGGTYTKHTLAELLGRDPQTTYRAIRTLHRDHKVIYISEWLRTDGGPSPCYSIQPKHRKEDVPMPSFAQQITWAERQRRNEKIAEARERKAVERHWASSVGRHVTYGFWGV